MKILGEFLQTNNGLGDVIFICRGGDIVTAAISHLAHSTPPEYLFCSTDFNSYGPVVIADTTAQRKEGRMAAPVTPGLGVTPRYEVLGKPIFTIE